MHASRKEDGIWRAESTSPTRKPQSRCVPVMSNPVGGTTVATGAASSAHNLHLRDVCKVSILEQTQTSIHPSTPSPSYLPTCLRTCAQSELCFVRYTCLCSRLCAKMWTHILVHLDEYVHAHRFRNHGSSMCSVGPSAGLAHISTPAALRTQYT